MLRAVWLTTADPAAMMDLMTGPRHARRDDDGAPVSPRIKTRQVAAFVLACRDLNPRERPFTPIEKMPPGWIWSVARSWCLEGSEQDPAAGRLPVGYRAALLREIVGDYHSPVVRVDRPCPICADSWIMPRGDSRSVLCRCGHDFEALPLHCLTPDVVRLAEAAYQTLGTTAPPSCPEPDCVDNYFQDDVCAHCWGRGADHKAERVDGWLLLQIADALRDAGCVCPTLLDHLSGHEDHPTSWDAKSGEIKSWADRRLGCPHVAGCWALDLLTGRAGR